MAELVSFEIFEFTHNHLDEFDDSTSKNGTGKMMCSGTHAQKRPRGPIFQPGLGQQLQMFKESTGSMLMFMIKLIIKDLDNLGLSIWVCLTRGD